MFFILYGLKMETKVVTTIAIISPDTVNTATPIQSARKSIGKIHNGVVTNHHDMS